MCVILTHFNAAQGGPIQMPFVSFLLKKECHCSSDLQRQMRRHHTPKAFWDGFGTLPKLSAGSHVLVSAAHSKYERSWGRCPL